MRERRRAAALLLSLLILSGLAAWIARIALAGRPFGSAELGVAATVAGFAVFGALIARHGQRSIGWSMLGFSASLTMRLVLEETVVAVGGDTVGLRAAVFGMSALDGVSLAFLVTVAILFPAGRPSAPRWGRLLATMWALAAIGALLAPFQSYAIGGVEVPSLWPVDGANELLFLVALPALLALGAAMARIVALRFRGDPVERRQIRWVSYVLGLILVLLIGAIAVPPLADAASVIAGFGIPLAIGVAITRYRLFEIDRIVSRTVTYVVVIALLAVVYGIVALGPTLLVGSARAPSWLVAAATLVVAALFRPLRRRVQHAVDRRFNRARYDAETLVEGFGERVRDETDADAITQAWSGEVGRILQPAHLGVWISRSPA